MKIKQNLFHAAAVVTLVGAAIVFSPQPVLAGDMIIEDGTVFSDTFTKDGRRVEVTKTYTRDGVIIHQKIYDDNTGELIRDKTTTNPIKDHVIIVSPGETDQTSAQQPDANLANEPAQEQTADKVIEPVEPIEVKETEADDAQLLSEEDAQAVELEKTVGADVIAEQSRKRYGFSRVNRVMVGQGAERSEISLEGTRTRKLLGLFDIELPTTIIVDGESGDLVDEKTSLRTRLLEMLSI